MQNHEKVQFFLCASVRVHLAKNEFTSKSLLFSQQITPVTNVQSACNNSLSYCIVTLQRRFWLFLLYRTVKRCIAYTLFVVHFTGNRYPLPHPAKALAARLFAAGWVSNVTSACLSLSLTDQ